MLLDEYMRETFKMDEQHEVLLLLLMRRVDDDDVVFVFVVVLEFFVLCPGTKPKENTHRQCKKHRD